VVQASSNAIPCGLNSSTGKDLDRCGSCWKPSESSSLRDKAWFV